jgi:pyruvate kinase
MKKLTKIVATISDRNCDVAFLKELFDAGMDVVRINTAHTTTDLAKMVIKNVREVSEKIAILIDTKGPEIRITDCPEKIQFKKGDKVKFKGDREAISTKECLYANFNDFAADVPIGASILIDDGEIEFKVAEKRDGFLHTVVQNDGYVGSHKSLNVPGVHIRLPSISKRDREFIELAIDEDLDFIAHSFVRNGDDVVAIQSILDTYNSDIKIIAKIENQQGVDNIDEILDHVFGVMIARGDLGIEIPAERIPSIQKNIGKKCIARRKPVIVATQMLHSMIENPRPTRAEVSDVANAIYEGSDAIMLSGETANGAYPVESVQIMTKIAREVEHLKKDFVEIPNEKSNLTVAVYLAKSAVKATMRLSARGIIADSIQGSTVRNIAAYRGLKPIYAMCYNKRLMRELALSFGVKPFYMEQNKATDEFLFRAVEILENEENIKDDDQLIVVAGNFGPGSGASFLEIGSAHNLKKRL